MILRLQREKAAEKMELCQYRRMAEEKMHHAEESVEILEEVIQENEMEISSLMYELEICKQKLASHGIKTPADGQINISEEWSFTRKNALTDKKNFHGFLRKNTSLPSLFQLDQLCSEMHTKCDECGIVESHEHLWKQAEEINNTLKELMQAKNTEEAMSPLDVATTEVLKPPSIDFMTSDQESASCSWYSAASGGTSFESKSGGLRKKLDNRAVSCLPSQVRGSESAPESAGATSSCLEAESNGNTVHPASLHDIFEISDIHKDCKPNHPCNHVFEAPVHSDSIMLGMPNLMPQESMDCFPRGDDWLNKEFTNVNYGNKLAPPRKAPSLQHGSKLSTPSKVTSLGYNWTLSDPEAEEIGTSQMDFEQLKLCLKHFEKERTVMQEDTERCKEQLTLLRNIFKQLDTIEKLIKRSASKKHSPHDDSKVVSVMEAMLFFSI
ncbi:uncharacterized protein LOC109837857 isoform X2 [Asparagus officinalis]|nr:uncharacterized protein LOC109837857 isoform X2 [Asparagus officinalis]